MEHALFRDRQEADVRGELAAGERLLWSGRPRQGVMLRASDAFQIPFSILWCGFAIFWESRVIAGGAPVFFMLWGIPFVAVGLYIVAGRFWLEARQRSRTRYALTDQRVIIVQGLIGREVISLDLRLLPEIVLAERGDSGTIRFRAGRAAKWPATFGAWPGVATEPSFERIEDARGVYQRIRKAQSEASAAPTFSAAPAPSPRR